MAANATGSAGEVNAARADRAHVGGQTMKSNDEYARVVRRLNHASTKKGHDAFSDVPWPEDGEGIEPHDPRFALAPDHPLEPTSWYRALPPDEQARFGLTLMMQTLKYGISFESVLSQGLLEYARTLPNGAPEFRYALHELIEESHHSLMFQELINRSGTDPRPFGGVDAFMDRRVPALGRLFPELFFGLVLAGELFIDRDNRRALRRRDLHPLFRRVIQIHVTEEARHLCFAREFLQHRLPELGPLRRKVIAWVLPYSLSDSAKKMLMPPRHVVQTFGIPKSAMREAFGPGSAYREDIRQAVEPVVALMQQHAMLGPAETNLWRRRGLLAAVS